ncbi:hypothetical protein BV20DRAFT_974605 [Pilatotrama ljubarskyi]|nr:hypothetical protein BV20DRAFT_974605 [Pilatotrama ljubarskyi]
MVLQDKVRPQAYGGTTRKLALLLRYGYLWAAGLLASYTLSDNSRASRRSYYHPAISNQ